MLHILMTIIGWTYIIEYIINIIYRSIDAIDTRSSFIMAIISYYSFMNIYIFVQIVA